MESIIISREYDQKKVSVFSPRTKESSQWNRYVFAESIDKTIDSWYLKPSLNPKRSQEDEARD